MIIIFLFLTLNHIFISFYQFFFLNKVILSSRYELKKKNGDLLLFLILNHPSISFFIFYFVFFTIL